FFTISREIRNQGTWDQAHCCFLIFPYILILFLEKNSNFRTYKWFEAEHNFYIMLEIFSGSDIKVMHHTNIGITGTIRRNLQRTTISYKHIQLHMEKK
ncbi:hypothetical protein Tsp_05435, partial [Trichinella spiralis]|uniref:hypothetical protein n=1 Tax=Trichinella spiralis TaxID=6334 RepID=UPI0001EFD763